MLLGFVRLYNSLTATRNGEATHANACRAAGNHGMCGAGAGAGGMRMMVCKGGGGGVWKGQDA